MRLRNKDRTYNRKLQYIVNQCDLKGQKSLKEAELQKLCKRETKEGEMKPIPLTTLTAWYKDINPLKKKDYNLILNSLLPWVDDQIVRADDRLMTLIEFHKTIITLLHNDI